MIQEGAVGRPLAVHARYNVWWPPDVPTTSGDDSQVWEQTDNRQMNWRQVKRIGGGGPMMDDGVHAIDSMVFLLGHVAEVSSFCDTLTRDRDIEDTASVLLKFESRAQGVLECADLSADGRLRQTQLLTRLRDCPLSSNHPEVQQVMVIQPFHR